MSKWISNLSKGLMFILIFTSVVSAALYEYPDLAGEANFINFQDFAAFAANWQKTGSGLVGDFDDSNTVDMDDLAYLSYYWLAGQWECKKIDLDYSGRIDFDDFVIFADCWLSDTGDINYKSNCDFDGDGHIDIYDLKAFSDCWLKGSRPEDIWEKFKAALAAGNVDEAVSYFADFVADDYRVIFNENTNSLAGLSADLGNLSLEYRDKDIAVYELSDVSGTNFFPVVFTLDDNNQWKIAIF